MKIIKNSVTGIIHLGVSTLIFCLILLPTLLQAREMTESEVRYTVQTWVRQVTAAARPDAMVERMEPYLVDGAILAYIAHLADSGFCLCGANDLVLPVYFYSPRGTYDPSIPDYQGILEEIAERVKYLQRGLAENDPGLQLYQQMLAERARFWQEPVTKSISEITAAENMLAEPMRLELDLTSTWHQRSPYNDRCPQLTPAADEHTLVGCGATAMSQIMYYWKWPKTGAGSGSTVYNYRWRNNWDETPLAANPNIPANWYGGGRLEWTAANGGRLRMNGYWDATLYADARDINAAAAYLNALQTLYNRLNNASTNCNANFGATSYNWGSLQDNHTDPSDAGDAAVAELCYHAGIAIENNYGVSSSGAPSDNVEGAFQNHFRYDTDADYQARDSNKMTTEILWLRPLYFHGSKPAGGHNWVVFGYNKGTDPNRQFLMNMGWGAGSIGWYSCDAVPSGYTDNQKHVIQLAPQNVVKFVGATSGGDGSPNAPYRNLEAAIVGAPDGATLIFKASSDNTFSAATLTITKPLTLKGVDVVIRKQ
ncbi:C10 family peptidase [candidate division KSB1 bacterium]|nr:C10 family peptidase [candidate division KSB1 bacterium]